MTHPKILFHFVIMYFSGSFALNLIQADKDINTLKEYFKSSKQDDSEQGSIFMTLLDSWKEEGEKKLLLSQIVPMYLKMFASIKNDSTPETQNRPLLNSITNIIHLLKNSHEDFLKQSDQKLKELNDLKNVQMSDSVVRHKAIKELFFVLRAIKSLDKENSHFSIKMKRNNQRKRRRSQN